MPTSSERRVTVHKTVYPKLEALAKRDGVTVADVANAIFLQTLQLYGTTSQQMIAPAVPMPQNLPDPYQRAAAVSDW